MENLGGIVLIALGMASCVVIVELILWYRRGKKGASIPIHAVAKSFGHMSLQLMEDVEGKRLKVVRLQTRILEIREQLLNLKETARKKNVTDDAEKWDIRQGLTEMILDESLWGGFR